MGVLEIINVDFGTIFARIFVVDFMAPTTDVVAFKNENKFIAARSLFKAVNVPYRIFFGNLEFSVEDF